MKKMFLITLIIIGIGIAFIFPAIGITALVMPVNSEDVILESDNEKIIKNMNEETVSEQYKNTIINEKAEEEIERNVEKADEETSHENRDNNSLVNQEIIIVSGESLKQSFIHHNEKIIKQTLTFKVIDKDNNITYYHDLKQLEKDISNDKKYEKQFELNPNGELIKYTYKECK